MSSLYILAKANKWLQQITQIHAKAIYTVHFHMFRRAFFTVGVAV